MNNQNLVIYDFNIIYDILKEIEDYLNFNLIKIEKSKLDIQKIKNQENFLIISKKEIAGFKNQIIINQFPLEISKLVESINIKFLKKIYNQQSEIDLGTYKLNLNSHFAHFAYFCSCLLIFVHICSYLLIFALICS